MANVNYTISANTWWTTGSSAGAADGSTFANRLAIPTNILSITVNADVGLYLVLETASGAIVLGANATAACTMTCYGGLYTVGGDNTFASLLSGGAYAAFRCSIGGTTGFKEGIKKVAAQYRIANIDFGADISGNPTGNGINDLQMTIEGYAYNCTVKNFYASNARGTLFVGDHIWEACTLNGGNSGAGVSICAINGASGNSATLIGCTQITTGANWLYTFGGLYTLSLKIVGGITKGGTGGGSISMEAQSIVKVQHYRRAYLKATSDGATALSGVAFGAFEATGGVDMPLSSGLSGAAGLCQPQSPTIYNDSIWALQKVELYVRTTAGSMTWGTPTSTTTYGNYTHFFHKVGYTPQSITHDYSDGNDYGSSTVPIAITMAKLSVIPTYSNTTPLGTFSDAACTIEASSFAPGATVNVNGDVALKGVGTDTRAAVTLVEVRKRSDDSLIATLYNDTDTLTGGTTYNYKNAAEFGGGTAWSWGTTGATPLGEYYIKVTTSGTDITTTYDREYFVIALSGAPVISSATVTPASITDASSANVEATITNMAGAATEYVYLVVATGKYAPMSTSDNIHYTATVSGRVFGVGSYSMRIIAANANGSVMSSALTLAITAADTDAVQLIVSLLGANWNAGNVALPTIREGGTAHRDRVASGDLIIVYRSPRPRVRVPRGEMQNYEREDEFVILDIISRQGRSRCEALITEATRVLNTFRNAPTGGFTRLWLDTIQVPQEFPDLFRATGSVTLTRLLRSVSV